MQPYRVPPPWPREFRAPGGRASTFGVVKIRNGPIELHVAADGDPAAPPILLLHGITSYGGTWDWIPPDLVDRFHVLRLDFRGHGASDRTPGDYFPEGCVSDAVDAIEQAAGKPCVVMGHSLGGATAAALVQQHADLVVAAVMEDPPLGAAGADGVSTTAVVARATLVGEYVEFLERDVPLAIGAAFAVFGSLVMIFLYDPMIGIAGALVAIPVVLLNRRLVRRSRRVYRTLNDRSELEVAVIETAPVEDVRRHYRLLGRHWNRLSDNEAVSWGIVDVIAVGLAVYALVRATDSSFEVGAIFATIAYVWAYLAGFDEVPGVLQRMSNLADIRRRIDVIESGGSSAPEEPDESLSSSP